MHIQMPDGTIHDVPSTVGAGDTAAPPPPPRPRATREPSPEAPADSSPTPAAASSGEPSPAAAEGGRPTMMIPWSDLHPSPTNPRKLFEGLDELAESIREKGQLVPVLVRPRAENGGYEIVAGERRYRAIGLLDPRPAVWCVAEVLDDVEVREVQIVENLHRRDVTPLEEADGFAALRTLGKRPQEIADRISKPIAYVYARLKLADLGAPAREAFAAGRFAAAVAERLARIPTAAAQAEATQRVLDMGEAASVQRVGEMIEQRFMVRIGGAPFDRKDAQLVPEAGACASCERLTGNMPDLVTTGGKSGTAADVCTDPPCYRAKLEAEWQRRVKKSKAAGAPFSILPAPLLAQLHQRNWVDEHLRADDINHHDPKRRTWRELLKKDPPRTWLGRTGDGEIVEYYEESEANERWEQGETFERPAAAPAPPPKTPGQLEEDRMMAVHRTRCDELHERLLKEAPRAAARPDWPLTGLFWQWLVEAIDACFYGEARDELLGRRGAKLEDLGETPGEALNRTWNKYITALSDDEKRGVAVELLLMQAGVPSERGAIVEARGWLERGAAIFLSPKRAVATKKAARRASANVRTARPAKKGKKPPPPAAKKGKKPPPPAAKKGKKPPPPAAKKARR